MAREVVLEARDLSRSFPAPAKSGRLFLDALFGRLQMRKPWHEALSGVDLELHKGETLGILGMNGAGKTTLLSILAGILPQTSGKVVRKGQVAAVLSLGQGINPQLTGRQNALLVCRSMGMSRRQAEAALPAVADYAELDEAFDQPMRTYSSGMRSRLAFAATIQTFAEIVILDEALAVGDLMFRMKCYQTLRELRASGRSIIMVAHSPDTLAAMSDRLIVLHKGQKVFDGSPVDGVAHYKSIRVSDDGAELGRVDAQPSGISIECLTRQPLVGRKTGETIELEIEIATERDMKLNELTLAAVDSRGVAIYSRAFPLAGIVPEALTAGTRHRLSASFRNWLSPGRYRIVALTGYSDDDGHFSPALYNPRLASLRIAGEPFSAGPLADIALVHIPYEVVLD